MFFNATFRIKEMLLQSVNKAELRFSFHQQKVKMYIYEHFGYKKDYFPVLVFALIIIICKHDVWEPLPRNKHLI